MELKEYIEIVKENIKLFGTVVLGVMILGAAIQEILPTAYKVEANLDITRSGQQNETTDYRYDEFYRLQADERFADTVVRWIGSGRIQEDIAKESKNVDFKRLKAMRLSSQLIKVNFFVANPNESEKVTSAISKVLNDKTQELNKDQKNPNWFKIIVSKPVVSEYKLPIAKLLMLTFVLGIFVGLWSVFINHYLK